MCVVIDGGRKDVGQPLEESKYDFMLERLKGENTVPERRLEQWQQVAVRQLRRWRQAGDVQVVTMSRVVSGRRIVVEKISASGRIVLRKADVRRVIERAFKKSKAPGNTKLTKTLKETYTGVSRQMVKSQVRNLPVKQITHPVFDNKAPPIPIVAKCVHERHQIDLVDLKRIAVTHNGIRYRYVLSVIDVFSLFLWLRAIPKKTSLDVSVQLQDIYNQTGTPSIIQCDNGGEFKGHVKQLCTRHTIKLINSSPYHPQSQGKIESSHKSWVKKVKYDVSHGQNWVNNLQDTARIRNNEYHRTLKMTPFEVFYGRKKRNPRVPNSDDRQSINSQALTTSWVFPNAADTLVHIVQLQLRVT